MPPNPQALQLRSIPCALWLTDQTGIGSRFQLYPQYYQDALQPTPAGDVISNTQPQSQQDPSAAVLGYSILATPPTPPVLESEQHRGGAPAVPPRPSTSTSLSPAPAPRRNSEGGTETREMTPTRRADGSSATSLPLPTLPAETVLQWTPPPPPEPLTPSQPLTYTFSPFEANSMLLLPPAGALDTRPKYHISVRQDCFMPLFFITTLRKGSSETGEYVGEFQMGISTEHATCALGRMQEVLHIDLKKDSSSLNKHAYRWRFGRFHWKVVMTGKIEARCYYASSNNVKLTMPLAAVFRPRDTLVRPRPLSSARPATLEVTPDGQAHFDKILLSALILERRRLTPRAGEHVVDQIFSHMNN